MDNVKTKKLTALISKLTVAANKAVKKHEPKFNPRKNYSITGLSSDSSFSSRGMNFGGASLLRG
jgi:hypothetical protein